jgi:1-acyl-sn-glycerol-3-phosphate acyltransferase
MALTPGGPTSWKAFELVFRPWLSRKVEGIHLAGLPPEGSPSLGAPAPVRRDPSEEPMPTGGAMAPEKAPVPLMLVGNHVSWFDGFLLREVQRRLRPRSTLRTVMLSSELRWNPVLRSLGGTGFDPQRPLSLRRVIRTLRSVRDEERRRGGLVVSFFPQGRIYPSFRRPLGFAGGVELLARVLAPCHVMGVGIHLEPGNRVAPSAFLHGAPPRFMDASTRLDVQLLERDVAEALDRIHHHLAVHGERGPDRWPRDGTKVLDSPPPRGGPFPGTPGAPGQSSESPS